MCIKKAAYRGDGSFPHYSGVGIKIRVIVGSKNSCTVGIKRSVVLDKSCGLACKIEDSFESFDRAAGEFIVCGADEVGESVRLVVVVDLEIFVAEETLRRDYKMPAF